MPLAEAKQIIPFWGLLNIPAPLRAVVYMRGPSLLTSMLFLLGWMLLSLSFVFSPSISIAKYVPDIRIEHSPPTSLPRGDRIHLKARISDPNRLNEVRCYFKYEAENSYLFVEMNQTEQGFECWLPEPASHIQQVEYVFVAVDSMSHVVRTHAFHASIEGDTEDRAVSSGSSELAVSVKSDVPIPADLAGGFATTDQPIYTVVTANMRFGLQVAIYDLSQDPGYGYGFFGGFDIEPNSQYISPVRGYRAFSASVSSGDRLLFDNRIITESYADQSYPNITGADWSGYFYVADSHGGLLSGKSPVTASVYHDGGGNVTIAISNHECPGRDSFSRGRMDTSGYILIYDDCDDEDWTTHWRTATSTSIQIMDFIDPPYYRKVNVVELTRSDPNPRPAAPTLISPLEGAIMNSRETRLQWNAANYAVNYQVQRGGSCDAGELYETSLQSYTLLDIEPSILNYWKVRGQNSIGLWGPWSPCWSFVTKPNCPACPVINSLLLDE